MRLREEKEGNSWQLLKEFWQAISAGFKYCVWGGGGWGGSNLK
jgi:hypothetical protein